METTCPATARRRPAMAGAPKPSRNLLPAARQGHALSTPSFQDTLVLVLGEFGRTPKINSRVGRDHWSNAMSVLMAGGGTPGGVVVGATDKKGYSAMENVKSPENFVSTVYSKLGINPDKILYTPQGRPTHLVSDATPISELMG